MKNTLIAGFVMLACSAVGSAHAEEVSLRSFIDPETVSVTADAIKVSFFARLNKAEIDDQAVDAGGKIVLQCTDKGDAVGLITVPGLATVWPKSPEEIKAVAIVTNPMGFSDGLESPIVTGGSIFEDGQIGLFGKGVASKAGRILYAEDSLWIKSSPGHGLKDVHISILPSFYSDSKRQLASFVKMCELFEKLADLQR